jgi:hypothetical protein
MTSASNFRDGLFFARFDVYHVHARVLVMRVKITIGVVAILVVAFIALRVYGAYQREQDDALEQAAMAEQKAKELNEESVRLKRQSDCNLLWIKYENAVLDKRIAELRGTFAPTPVEPACTGHAERMDEVLDFSSKQMQVTFAALDASEFARYERVYAGSRKYQTRYLLSRLWAFLTGTNPKMKPAEMVAKFEKAAQLDTCMKTVKNDSDRKNCEDLFGKSK